MGRPQRPRPERPKPPRQPQQVRAARNGFVTPHLLIKKVDWAAHAIWAYARENRDSLNEDMFLAMVRDYQDQTHAVLLGRVRTLEATIERMKLGGQP